MRGAISMSVFQSDYFQLTFPEIESILLNCLPRPRVGVLHVPQVISSFDNMQDLIEIDIKRNIKLPLSIARQWDCLP